MSTADVTLAPSVGGRALPWVAAGVLTLAFLCTEHQLRASQMDEFGTSQEELEQKASKGNVFNQVGFTSLALLGGTFLVLPGGRPWRLEGVLPVVLLLFLGWCAASLSWSIDPGRTGKRLVIVLFCLLGALGIGRRLGPRELCAVCLAVTATFALAGIAIELALGTFKPWGGDYRFAGTMHPNAQGVNCALFCLSAVLLLGGATRARPQLIALLATGAVLLLLTKSRTSCFGVLLVLAALRGLKKPAGLLLVLAGVLLAL
ncbi:MAG TPA: hypothetical protein VFW33_10445, partial [Gemmataceae bacterium]|nr:hypothetical protein [Gemmataceae bacterium]